MNIFVTKMYTPMKTIPFTIYEYFIKIITSQDFQQKLQMSISVTLEFYRVLVSSLLVIFVPHSCGDHICTIQETVHYENTKYTTGLITNYITFGSFILMYICEIRREEKLIKLLEVNNKISTDNISIGKRLDILPEVKKTTLFNIDKHYKYISYFVMFMYAVNIISSGIAINEYSLGNQTILFFVTNILFMITKLSNVYIIINTEKNIFFSAYLNTKVQFNDIDPREVQKISKRRSIEVLTLHIAETGGRNLLEKPKIKFLEQGGFKFIDSSDSDEEQKTGSNEVTV